MSGRSREAKARSGAPHKGLMEGLQVYSLMNKKRQKNPKGTSRAEGQGEALKSRDEGFEVFSAKIDTKEPAVTELMEEILDAENMKAAVRKVRQNKGSAGIDRVTVDDLGTYLKANWADIERKILAGTYQPKPVRQVDIPKPDGGLRKLGIPCVIDRVIQQAILQCLEPVWDPTFNDQSYGFRKGRSQHQAVERAQKLIQEENYYVVDLDLEKFFDRVNHDILMDRVSRRVKDKRVLKLVRAILNSGILDNGLVEPYDEGVPQGGPLSPLLSNLILDELDQELDRRKLQFVRYADDCNIYVKSERAGLRVKESITRFLAKQLRLKVNEEKSAVGKPQSRTFLGFTFGKAPRVLRIVSKKALKRARQKIQQMTNFQREYGNFERCCVQVGQYLRGWLQYFGKGDTPSDIKAIFGYARRRLRLVAWQNWRVATKRRRGLMSMGIAEHTATIVANSSMGAWRIAGNPAMHKAFPNKFFHQFGFPEMLGSLSL